MQIKVSFLFVSLVFFYSLSASALKIRFPDEELAKESVLPLVEPHNVVLNRNVYLKRRVEAGVGLQFALGEPFYFPNYPAFSLGFHFAEVHSFHLLAMFMHHKIGLKGIQPGLHKNTRCLTEVVTRETRKGPEIDCGFLEREKNLSPSQCPLSCSYVFTQLSIHPLLRQNQSGKKTGH